MKIALVRDVKSPVRGTKKSAGIDFFIPNDFAVSVINPGEDILIPSGVKAEIPEGYMLMAAEKSGVVTSKQACLKAGREPKALAFTSVAVLGAKIVDEDYQGEIHIHIVNVGNESVTLYPGTKIAQFILVPVKYEDIEVCEEDELFVEKSERADKGFGKGTGEK